MISALVGKPSTIQLVLQHGYTLCLLYVPFSSDMPFVHLACILTLPSYNQCQSCISVYE